ncbi:MAG: ribosome maturation factor RimP [Candidatus Omnitrophica bacterium]|nr:ribosome maturation factor RimP [Candidatus Omnitrophota bacterium]
MNTDHLKDVVRDRVKALGMSLIDLNLRRGGGRPVLAVIMDKEGGVTLDDCVRVSQDLSRFFDETPEEMPGSYLLEVSSPGLDRPLKTAEDFERVVGRLVRVTARTSEPGKTRTFTAKVLSVSEGRITFEAKNQGAFDIALDSVIRAVREIGFK